jgi:hypothetical protein
MNQMMQAMGNQQGEAEGEGPIRTAIAQPMTAIRWGARAPPQALISAAGCRFPMKSISSVHGKSLMPSASGLATSCRRKSRSAIWSACWICSEGSGSGRLSGQSFRNRLADLRQRKRLFHHIHNDRISGSARSRCSA